MGGGGIELQPAQQPDQAHREYHRQQRIPQKANEDVQQQKAVVLQQHHQGHGDAGMVQEEFVSPGIGSVDLPEVEEGDGKQEQGHGAQHAHARPLAPLPVFPEDKGRQHGQGAESEGDQPEPELMGSHLGAEYFSQMDAAGQQSHSVAGPAEQRTP